MAKVLLINGHKVDVSTKVSNELVGKAGQTVALSLLYLPGKGAWQLFSGSHVVTLAAAEVNALKAVGIKAHTAMNMQSKPTDSQYTKVRITTGTSASRPTSSGSTKPGITVTGKDSTSFQASKESFSPPAVASTPSAPAASAGQMVTTYSPQMVDPSMVTAESMLITEEIPSEGWSTLTWVGIGVGSLAVVGGGYYMWRRSRS